jgi:glutamate 5-kinase
MRAYTAAFARHDRVAGQVLLTVDDVTRRAHYRNAYRTLRRLLDLGAVPIVNENDTVATEEIRFGDNDRLAALVAALVRADLLVLLSDVDALYSGNPARPGARRIDEVRCDADLAGSTRHNGRASVEHQAAWSQVERRIATGAASRWC